jgi:glycosyltransferase involved in cell wall biosynthesis
MRFIRVNSLENLRPLRIAFNARLLYAPLARGWNRYTINLLAELPTLGVELFLYADRPLHESYLTRLPRGSYRIRVAPAMRYALWEQRWLARQCATDRVDLLHCPVNFGLPCFSSCPRVLTLHDAIEQVYHKHRITWRANTTTAALRTRLCHWIARCRAHHVITVSQHAKRDLVRHLRVQPEKITVVYEAADALFHTVVLAARRLHVRERYALTKPYVFYVGGWEERKNVAFLIQAFAAANLAGVELVLAGGSDEQQAKLLPQVKALGLAHRVRLLGWVDDADLPALYAEALCFVYPSAYEGFGLQLCEAMAIGSPTLAARATSLPEVLGNGGDTFPLDDPSVLAHLLRRLNRDAEYRSLLADRARARAKEFSWRRTARETVAVYLKALRTRSVRLTMGY